MSLFEPSLRAVDPRALRAGHIHVQVDEDDGSFEVRWFGRPRAKLSSEDARAVVARCDEREWARVADTLEPFAERERWAIGEMLADALYYLSVD